VGILQRLSEDLVVLVASLQKLTSLSGETEVYCGHEYTVKNLDFAAMAGAHIA
jgi:glyoxylase-like metal-dependent hydrolase (beta-lactamase superfamily II)